MAGFLKTLVCVVLLQTFCMPLYAQNKTVDLLKSKPWIMCSTSLLDTAGMSYEETTECRHLFEFMADGTIKYTDLLTSYDPSGACSNAFRNYTGSWSVKKGIVHIVLEYNAYSGDRFLVYNYTLKRINDKELSLESVQTP